MNRGATTPRPSEREPEAVRSMFSRIAPRYDLANHILSGGADFFWRARVAKLVANWQPSRVLDLATGSGDLALAIARRLPNALVVAADFSEEMLAVARRKGVRETALVDALNLPFDEDSFDCITVAFGLRNMSDWGVALCEMARVLSVNGHAVVLDFSVPEGMLRFIYRFYLHRVLPHIAGFLTGEKDAYNYLGASIEKFPKGREMLRLMEGNGFTKVTARPMTGGVVTLYVAQKD